MKKMDYTISPQRQAQILFFDNLKEKVNAGDPTKECLGNLLEAFVNFCNNVGIINSFTGLHSPQSVTFDERLKQNLLMNIDMARSAAAAKSQGDKTTSISISNSNQQEQRVEAYVIYEALRKSLTGEQLDDIKELVKKNADKKSVKEKLLSFGSDVLSNVLATLISTGVNEIAF